MLLGIARDLEQQPPLMLAVIVTDPTAGVNCDGTADRTVAASIPDKFPESIGTP